MDESIGAVVKKLEETGILENTIIIFTSDNGGTRISYEHNVGSNWPLRGEKSTVWEGGVRAAGDYKKKLYFLSFRNFVAKHLEISYFLQPLFGAPYLKIWDKLATI